MVFQFLVRLRTYSVSFVSSVVEKVACMLVITKWLWTFTTEAQSALRTRKGVCYSNTHSIQRGTTLVHTNSGNEIAGQVTNGICQENRISLRP